MKLVCEKYQEAVAAAGACCRHPTGYCKFRPACLIHFRAKGNGGAVALGEAGPQPGLAEEESAMTIPRFDKGGGLIPAIAQDYQTGEVLMLAYVNEEAWQRTVATGKAHYWSRSRGKLWLKGESSGHVQLVKEILLDCDADAVLYKVEQLGGAACHTGHRSCFHRVVRGGELIVVGERVFDPAEVYKK